VKPVGVVLHAPPLRHGLEKQKLRCSQYVPESWGLRQRQRKPRDTPLSSIKVIHMPELRHGEERHGFSRSTDARPLSFSSRLVLTFVKMIKINFTLN